MFVTAAFIISLITTPIHAADMTGNIKGKVLETMDVESYTYARLKTDSGETWAAVPKTKIEKGATIEIANPMVMDGFESKSLKRKFDHIIFGSLTNGKEATETDNPHGMGMSGGGSKLGPVPFSKIKIAKAEGIEGHTIAEIYAQKTDLKGKSVAVRGKVVKYTPGVMGANWIHLRDGTGSESANNFDLTASSNDTTKVGDTVVVKGTLATDKDLGAGYFYPALVENAKVQKK